MLRKVTAAIKADGVSGEINVFRDHSFIHMNLWEVHDYYGPTSWHVTFNGNSKQRRQQRRKMIRDLSQEKK